MGSKIYNGFIDFDFETPEAPDPGILQLLAPYIMSADIHAVGVPEELINKLDLTAGVTLHVRRVGEKKSEDRSQETE